MRGLIEKLIKTIEPSARLLSFGSSCNSFGLRNSGEYSITWADPGGIWVVADERWRQIWI